MGEGGPEGNGWESNKGDAELKLGSGAVMDGDVPALL